MALERDLWMKEVVRKRAPERTVFYVAFAFAYHFSQGSCRLNAREILYCRFYRIFRVVGEFTVAVKPPSQSCTDSECERQLTAYHQRQASSIAAMTSDSR